MTQFDKILGARGELKGRAAELKNHMFNKNKV